MVNGRSPESIRYQIEVLWSIPGLVDILEANDSFFLMIEFFSNLL